MNRKRNREKETKRRLKEKDWMDFILFGFFYRLKNINLMKLQH